MFEELPAPWGEASALEAAGARYENLEAEELCPAFVVVEKTKAGRQNGDRTNRDSLWVITS